MALNLDTTMDPNHPDTEQTGLLCQIITPIDMLGYGVDANKTLKKVSK